MKYTIEPIGGIDVIFAPMEDAYSVTIEIMCKAGSIYENRENNGISHFLEHLFFKGGKKYPTPKAVAEVVDKFGGEFNAYTGDEYAGYYVKCAPEFIDKAIDVLADMMNHAKFNTEELEREKGVVIQELKMYEDNPMAMAMQKRQSYYFGDNNFGRPIVGTEKNINAFTQQMLFDHKANLYTKDNLIIVIAGKISNKQAVIEQLNKEFSNISPSKKGTKPTFIQTLPTEHTAFYEQKNEQAHLVISAPGFDGNDETRYAANVLGTILGGNMSSRLFQNIREKQGLCYYIKGSHMSQEDFGVFLIRAGIDKKRFDFGVEKIFEEIQYIAEGNITQEEFDNAIGYNEGQIQMGIESSDEMASFVGNQYLIYKKIESLEEILKKYKRLTLKDVQAVAKKLSKENLYLFYIK
ncbi:MAG: pitrilysin family protein [candidate division SR1 bacterium]|nr:pitrilysin family protein [candidate division SR1 bacterium]